MWSRRELEEYKAAFFGRVFEPGPDFVDSLVPANEVAAEFGIGRRSLGRRIVGVETKPETARA
jgi:hypothetical protein